MRKEVVGTEHPLPLPMPLNILHYLALLRKTTLYLCFHLNKINQYEMFGLYIIDRLCEGYWFHALVIFYVYFSFYRKMWCWISGNFKILLKYCLLFWKCILYNFSFCILFFHVRFSILHIFLRLSISKCLMFDLYIIKWNIHNTTLCYFFRNQLEELQFFHPLVCLERKKMRKKIRISMHLRMEHMNSTQVMTLKNLKMLNQR